METLIERGVREKVPTRWESFVFSGKVWGLRAKRWWNDRGQPMQRWPGMQSTEQNFPARVEARSPLWIDVDPRERMLEEGKVQNLRQACAQMDGSVIEADGVFSFWAQIGKATPARGFTVGRMLQQGCVIPSVGGGLCQLSNALYGLALEANCEIVERHAHSVRLPGAPARDATVAWNYVDLRFRVRQRTRIVAEVTADELIVGLEMRNAVHATVRLDAEDAERQTVPLQNCLTCNEVGCFRHHTGRRGEDKR